MPQCTTQTKLIIAGLSLLILCGLGVFIGCQFIPGHDESNQNRTEISHRAGKNILNFDTLEPEDCKEHPATRICDGSGTDAEAGQYDLTKEQCSSLCWNSPTCVAWTFHSKGACYTKQGDFQCVQASEDWVWGTKKCGDPNN